MTTSGLAKGWSNAEVYSRTFGRLCDGTVAVLLDGLTPTSGGLLDVGTGPGRLAREASERGWTVTAVDPSVEMLDIARTTAPSAICVEAALPDLPCADGSFDAVVASYVVNHLDDPRGGVSEMTRVLRRGGVLAVTIWPAELTAMNQMWAAVVERARVERPAAASPPAGSHFARTEAGLARLLVGAGLAAETSVATWDFVMDADLLWSGVEAGIAAIGTTYLAQGEDGRSAMAAAYREVVEETSRDGVLRLPSRALVAHGTKV